MIVDLGHERVIAHRGASAHAPEHSFAAYDLALETGAEAIELDLRPARGGQLVALHDATLERTTGDPRHVAELMTAELAALPAATRPPELDDVLERYGRGTRYWIEIKDPRPCDEHVLVDALARHGLRDRVTIQSFDRFSLRRFGRLDPGLRRVALRHPGARGRRPRAGGGLAGIGVEASTVDAALVLAAHSAGLTVHAYTVNDPSEMERLLALGVDGLFTDTPERARELPSRRAARGGRRSA